MNPHRRLTLTLATAALAVLATLGVASPASAVTVGDKLAMLSNWTQSPVSSYNAWYSARQNQGTWVDVQIQQAVARGDFDDLPGYGKPLRLTDTHDPDWWVKGLVERENITGVLPPALQIRKDDAALDGLLDRLNPERQVREAVEEFAADVRKALYSTWGDPPVVTSPRDVEQEVTRWRERRTRL